MAHSVGGHFAGVDHEDSFFQRFSKPHGSVLRAARRASTASILRNAIEFLEPRVFLSASPHVPRVLLPGLQGSSLQKGATHPLETSHSSTSNPNFAGFVPNQIRQAYGIDRISFSGGVTGDGTGQTIAIVDAYDDPNIASDLQHFDQAFGIAAPPSFRRVAQDGSTNYPIKDPKIGPGGDNWEEEIALDVEWAHAVAPGASISSLSRLIPTSVPTCMPELTMPVIKQASPSFQ